MLLLLADFNEFFTLEWFRIDLGIFEFGLVNLIGVVRYSFMDSSCLGIVWVDLADSKTFDGICVDLKGLRYSEDRFKLIFEGLGRFLWIRVKMATDLDGSGKIWMTLSGFDWILADLVHFWAQIRVDF